MSAVRVVVLPQLRAQPARLAANNRVDLRVEGGRSFVNLDANQVLAELIALVPPGSSPRQSPESEPVSSTG